MMILGMWINLGWMLFVALVALGLLIWGWRRGQFRDVEQPKYRMLQDREPEPWPSDDAKKKDRL
jgi:cbb3-type cytochrome oxidase maturation protein